jgi:hypothetical protein
VGAEAATTGIGQVEGAFERLLEVLLLDGADLTIAGADSHTEMQEDSGGSEALTHRSCDVGLAPEQGVVVMGDADCFQKSISAYYYTSVHAYFIGALVAIGVCLFCLKGSTEVEDVGLNLAGMFAPVVALVPTPGPGECGVIRGTTKHIHDNVINNVTALLVVGFIALVILAALSSRALPSRAARRGYAVAATAWLAGGLVFIFAPDFFVKTVHYVAAVCSSALSSSCASTPAATGTRGQRHRYATATGPSPSR